MTYVSQRIPKSLRLRPQILSLALICLVLIAIQATPATAQWTTVSGSGKTTTNDKVGIGTTDPAYKIQVVGTNEGPSLNSISGIVAIDGGVGTNQLTIGSYAASPFGIWLQAKDNAGGGGSGWPSYPISLNPLGGNVGIGIPNPSEKLEVLGNIKVSGNINAKFQDLAEWVPASEQISAGTFVVLDSTKSNHVIPSTTGYDTRVAGVISAQPGIALGESGDNKVLVATTGRVRIKVDATRSPIRVGDLLVTSNVPGLAMKSIPIKVSGRLMHMPGTLIGKALEPLERGSGTILVLLSLQ